MLTHTTLPKTRRLLPAFLPAIVVVVAAAVITTIWYALPIDWLIDMWRYVATEIILMLTGLILAVWWLAYSRLAWTIKGVVLLGMAGLAVGFFRSDGFAGDMIPIIRLRWAPTPDQMLQAYRQQHAAPSAPTTIAAPEIKPMDAPAFRGKNRDGIVIGPPLARDWAAHPPRELWRHPIGGGHGGIAVVGNLAITIEQRGEQEAIVAYNTDTGEEQWDFPFGAHFKEAMGGPGPRTTPTIAGNSVVALGAEGHLICLDLTKPKKAKWGPIVILNNHENLPWGMSGSPLIYDLADGRSVVVVTPGNQGSGAGRAIVAYDLATGKEVWANGDGYAGYGSPQLATLCGKRQLLHFDGDGVAGYDLENGKQWWRSPWATHQKINCSQPIVVGDDLVYISSGYNVGGGLVKVSESDGIWKEPEKVWEKKNKPLRLKFSSGVLRAGLIYGLDEGFMACIDAQSGDLRWRADRKGQYGHGQILLSDDLILVLGESGQLVLVEATPERFRELGKIQAFNDKTWNTPTLVNGRAYLRNDREIACYDLTAK
jgi:outer membrane protein assembly factor BamB